MSYSIRDRTSVFCGFLKNKISLILEKLSVLSA